MGEHFKRMKGKSYTVISPDDDFEKIFGRKADKRRKLYNGSLNANFICILNNFHLHFNGIKNS